LNRLDLWRYFGSLPEIPESAYTGDPDQAIISVTGDSERISVLFMLALSFSRLDSLGEILTADDWENSAEGLLNRGRLRFYRVLAENPDSPEPSLLEEAALDFRRASEFPDTRVEAFSGLLRIQALTDGVPGVVKQIRSLEYLKGIQGHQAAAGVWLFLAGLQEAGNPTWQKYLKKAQRNLHRSGKGFLILFTRFLVDKLQGHHDRSRRGMEELSRKGFHEAGLWLIQDGIEEWKHHPVRSRKEKILAEIAGYRSLRPSDPRTFIAEGDLLITEDSESAHMAWRTALVLDERCSDAWMRLGWLYHNTRNVGEHDFGNTFLEAAEDAYLKALGFAPLNPVCRLSLGQVERDSGQPGRAVGTLLGGLALNPGNTDIRRLIALCWNDLADSADLSFQASSAAAGRARIEWELILGSEERIPADLLGILKSMALEIIAEPEKTEELEPHVSGLMDELFRIYIPEDPDEFVSLAEDFIRAGLWDNAGHLLDISSAISPDHPGVKAAWGRLRGNTDPLESMRLFVDAASTKGPRGPQYVNWLLNASEMAASAGFFDEEESILRTGLIHHPENIFFLKRLSGKLMNEKRTGEAVDLYRKSLAGSSDNPVLLEEAIWFFRTVGFPDLAESILLQSLENSPEDSRLWNQLGVHFMETGWDESSEQMVPEALSSAVHAYSRALEIVPEDPVFMGNLGDALRQKGQFTEAENYLIKAVESGTDSVEDAFALNSLARLEDEKSYAVEGSDTSANDWESSGNHYRAAAEIGSGNADFQRDYAWWLYRERRLEEAVEFYRRAEKNDPSDSSLPYGESVCFLELGKEEEALNALDRALSIAPSDTGMLVDKADLLGSAGKTVIAEGIYRDVLLKTENASWVWERLAVFRDLRAEEAEPRVAAPVLFPDNPELFDIEIFLYRGRPSGGSPHRQAALKAWNEAWILEPDNMNIAGGYAAALLAVEHRDEAGEILRTIRGLPEAQNLLGRLELYESCKHSDRALRSRAGGHLTGAVNANPDSPSYHADIGFWYSLDHQWEKARDAFIHAADGVPGNPEYSANAGITAYAAGYFEESAAYLERALAVGENSAHWQNALGMALLASGNPKRSLEAFRSACLADPFNDVFPANLAMAHESLHTPPDILQ